MGRIAKQKRLLIEEANKRILTEEPIINEIAPWVAEKGQGNWDPWRSIKAMLYSLEKRMDEEEMGQHIKNLQSHIQELIYIQNNK